METGWKKPSTHPGSPSVPAGSTLLPEHSTSSRQRNPSNQTFSNKRTDSRTKRGSKLHNVESLLQAMEAAYSALDQVTCGVDTKEVAEVREAMVRNAADVLQWWITKMRDTQEEKPLSAAQKHLDCKIRDAAVQPCDLHAVPNRRESSHLIADASRNTDVDGKQNTTCKEPAQHETPFDFAAQIEDLIRERDQLRQAYRKEVKQREHYQALSGTLVDKMASILEALKKEHKQKMKRSREQLAYMEVETERYMRMYEAELDLHRGYQEECLRLHQDVAYLRKKTNGCGAQCETSVFACMGTLRSFLLWLLSLLPFHFFSRPPPPSPNCKATI